MKKIVGVLLLLTLFIKPNAVFASEYQINYKKLPGIYFNLNINGVLDSNLVTSFHLGDRIAYCIEPGVDINTRYYDSYDNWDVTNLPLDIREYIEKVGYYGYEYPGHQTDRYYIAAQELIWKKVRPDMDVTWTTEKNLGGSVIDVSFEKEEILNLLNSHLLEPSFSSQKISGYVGDEIVLTDENNVLDNYEISESKYHSITTDGNKLIIKFNNEIFPEEQISLKRKYYDNAPLIVYSRGDSQKLAAIRITSDKETFLTISNKERPFIVEVPDTGKNINLEFAFLLVFLGISMIIYAIKVC